MPIEVRDGIAVVTIENPPVNALGPASVPAILAQIDAAEAEASVRAIVLIGANGTFSGGADMKAFGTAVAGPTTGDLIARIESARVPFVAAIDGNALGGGLEAALGCDYRIATASAKLGFPEIKRGLVPGAGGTQRAPRLMGTREALTLILGGEPISGAQAHEARLVDRVAANDLLADAIAFAREAAADGRRLARAMPVNADDAAIAEARAKAAPPDRGGLAEHGAIDAVANAAATTFDEGIAAERQMFLDLLHGEQSAARIYLFFCEKEAAKLPDGSSPPPFRVRSCAVVGSGTMGTGIAMSCANAGVTVTLLDLETALLERARTAVIANYAATVKKGRLAPTEMDARLSRISYTTDFAAAGTADLVIEAVFEDMSVKQDVFRTLDAIVRDDAILASNTSTLDVDALASVVSRPEDFVGMHFFSPANVMRLLEIVRGSRTSIRTLGRAIAVGKALGKVPVVAGNCDGFIGNRMLYAYRREAEFLLEEGASPQRVDTALKRFGLAMGPFAMSDLAGLDIGWRVRKRRHAEKPPTGRYSKIADTLCEAGRFGQKTGAGYFKYNDGDRTPIPDPFVDDVIAKAAAAAGITRREITDDELIRRCMYPLVNEGARIVREGVAARPGDIDVVYCNGYGFPAWRGGPMRWADTIGLDNVYRDILSFREAFGEVWEPAPLLRELAERGGTFGSWKREEVAAVTGAR